MLFFPMILFSDAALGVCFPDSALQVFCYANAALLPPSELSVANDLWPGLLRRGDDAHGGPPLRHGPLRRGLQSQSPAGRRHDCGRNADQQDGSSSAQGQNGGGACPHR